MTRSLQEELKMTRPFSSLEEEALLTLARTSAVMEHETAQALKPYDLTPTQYNVLRILRGAGPAGLCRNEVGERLVRQVPDVTRLLDRLEEAGLITRQRIGEDRRFVTTSITSAGLELLERLDTKICAINRGQIGHLSADQLRTLIDLLNQVREKA